MDCDRYERITRELIAWAGSSPEVAGLVAVGSTAGRRRAPDQWSDHDLVVVTRAGAAQRVRDDPSWLPDPDRIVIAFTEPDHGLNVIYRDGHLIEFAICDAADLGWLRTIEYRVLVGGAALEDRLAETVRAARAALAGADPGDSLRYHRFIKEMVIGGSRLRRGELFSASAHIRGRALPLLLDLVASFVPSTTSDVLDRLDPARRFELAYPDIARDLSAPLESSIRQLFLALLTVAERSLVGRLPAATPASIEAARRRVRA